MAWKALKIDVNTGISTCFTARRCISSRGIVVVPFTPLDYLAVYFPVSNSAPYKLQASNKRLLSI
jgi:hypothetical protein